LNSKDLASRIATANESGLVAILYEGLIEILEQGYKDLQENQETFFKERIEKAKNVVAELLATLKGNSAIANQLRSLYVYIYRLITKAFLNQDGEKLEEAIRILIPLKEAWSVLENQEFEQSLQQKQKKPQIVTGATYEKGALKDYVIDQPDKWGRG
jgi:flagellar protein FliS